MKTGQRVVFWKAAPERSSRRKTSLSVHCWSTGTEGRRLRAMKLYISHLSFSTRKSSRPRVASRSAKTCSRARTVSYSVRPRPTRRNAGAVSSKYGWSRHCRAAASKSGRCAW